jgi:hypothetical protein
MKNYQFRCALATVTSYDGNAVQGLWQQCKRALNALLDFY